MMIFRHHPQAEDIIKFLRDNISYLTYEELIQEVKIHFNYEFRCQESLSYHLKQNGIKKGYDKKYKTKNIKGLRKAFESDLFKLERMRKGD